jgi:hypothetical protein
MPTSKLKFSAVRHGRYSLLDENTIVLLESRVATIKGAIHAIVLASLWASTSRFGVNSQRRMPE